MNCIFCCVFDQEKNVDTFLILLESIFIYGILDANTDMLVYTSTKFMNIIRSSHLFYDKIKFELNDNIDNVYKARLDLFNFRCINNYNKILYLDINSIVKDDINKIFNVCKDDVLYVLEENLINSDLDEDWWGKTLFTCGILLFNNCEIIKDLFNKINEDITKGQHECNQQIKYNTFKYDLYNNKILKDFIISNDNNINSDKVIHHFSVGQEISEPDINAMTNFLQNIKDFTICNAINAAKII